MLYNLTDEIVCDLVASTTHRLEIADGAQSGLRLRLGARTASWSVFISGPRIDKVRVSLGSWPALSVAAARRRAESIWEDYRRARSRELEGEVVEGLLERYADERLSQLRTGEKMSQALRVGLGRVVI
jgi:hypothetical protein